MKLTINCNYHGSVTSQPLKIKNSVVVLVAIDSKVTFDGKFYAPYATFLTLPLMPLINNS